MRDKWRLPVKCGAMKKLYRVKLTVGERAQLQELLSKGKAAARTLAPIAFC